MSVLHQSMCIFKAGLSSLSDDWVKYKEKVPDVLDSHQNVETTCNSKLKFTELKVYSSKGCRKTTQRLIMYAANTAILKLRIFNSITSDNGFLLRLVNTFTADTKKCYPRFYKVNDPKTFKNLVVVSF